MKYFTELLENISFARNENYKIQLLKRYFESEDSSSNKDEALNLIVGNSPKRIVSSNHLKNWATELTGYSAWMIDRSEKEVGNFMKTLALLIKERNGEKSSHSISHWLLEISRLSILPEDGIKKFIKTELGKIEPNKSLIILNLLTGTFKVPVSNLELINCLSNVLNLAPAVVSLRLFEEKTNMQLKFSDLNKNIEHENQKIPYPFPEELLIEDPQESLKYNEKWEAYGYQEGIECQIVKHRNKVYLWTSEYEIISDKFPEIVSSCKQIHVDFVAHGQIVVKNHDSSLELLKNRINKKTITTKDLQISSSKFSIWNIMHFGDKKTTNSNDVYLNYFSNQNTLELNKKIEFSSFAELQSLHERCRDFGFSGVILKNKEDINQYYLWKAKSFTFKGILMYVEMGDMGNSPIKSMTFGVNHQGGIITVTKVVASLDSADTKEMISFIKENTLERFGPVRTLKPSLVYELHFDGSTSSSRRKSGLALSNVVIKQKISANPDFADSLKYLKALN